MERENRLWLDGGMDIECLERDYIRIIRGRGETMDHFSERYLEHKTG